MKKNTEKAFNWIVNILNENKIPFQLTGGVAARLYGSDRPINDIDIEIEEKHFKTITPLVENYIIYSPQRYKSNEFDLLLMTLEYEGQEIDISGYKTDKLYNKETQKWESCRTYIHDAINMELYGIKIPVIKWQHLVSYKKKTRRRTDIEDVNAIIQKNS